LLNKKLFPGRVQTDHPRAFEAENPSGLPPERKLRNLSQRNLSWALSWWRHSKLDEAHDVTKTRYLCYKSFKV